MSVAQPEQAGNRTSPGLTLNLSSNNPFRNRAASPAFSNGQPSPLDAPPRPVSRNPFLDASAFPAPAAGSPDKMSFSPDAQSRPVLSGNAAELFDNLTLNDRQSGPSHGMRQPPPRSNTSDKAPPPYSSRAENVPPRGPPGHRPSRSQEEALRARKNMGGSISKPRPTAELDIFADPVEASSSRRTEPRRVRRNSESSILERSNKPLSPEEEKKQKERERRRRERKQREREGSESRPKKTDRKLDIIDKLDVTSIYGTGLFHHDGPFDACNPHRNRQGSRRAPMQAFPKDSLNNVLGGGGPINKRPDHATFLGNNDEEAFKDYSRGVDGNGPPRPMPYRQESIIQSATTKVEPIHGEETLGLGTSTFLEGAPASRTAMQRRDSEVKAPAEGLGRKKSLAQRIRGVNSNRRDYGPSGRITSPEGVTGSLDAPVYTPGGSRIHESNPFFNEFSKGDDTISSRKEGGVTIVEPERSGRARAPSSPRRGFGERLERRVTSDGSSSADQQAPPAPKIGGSFLSRVKSLKGGPRKPRTDKSMAQLQDS